MLTPEEIQGIANDLSSIYSRVENDCIATIAKAIASGQNINDAQLWQMRKLADVGFLKRDLYTAISRASKASIQDVETLVERALSKSIYNDFDIYEALSKTTGSSINRFIDLQNNETFQRILRTSIKGVKNSLNLTGTKALQGSIVAYTKAINMAYLEMASGNMSRQDAVEYAVSRIAQSGITIVDDKKKVKTNELVSKKGELFTTYKNGEKIHVYPLDSAVRRNICTQINKASSEVCLADCDELGVSLVETSWHNGARPEHEVWQGKVFSLDPNNKKYPYFYGLQDAGCPEYGSMLGICGINCYHSFSPYIEGSPLRSQEGKLSREDNNKQYENQQKQRGYERQLRALKREKVALTSAGYEDRAKQIQDKINTKTANYTAFLREAGLTRRTLLERV